MSDERGITRREALVALGGLAAGAALGGVAPTVWERVVRRTREVQEAPQTFVRAFFTDHEWETVRLLVDLVIPADSHSGSATDAGVPEFMDFMLVERESMQTPMRGGLHWLDSESVERFGAPFLAIAPDRRTAILDDIAWPARARPEMTAGVTFFTFFRDLTAAGFFSSKVGMEDLRYVGNRAVARWEGCPAEAISKLGVSYDIMGPREWA